MVLPWLLARPLNKLEEIARITLGHAIGLGQGGPSPLDVGQMMIESRPGERLSNGTRVYHPIIDFPTSKDMGHPVGLVPQVSKSICTRAQVSLNSVPELPIAESPTT